MCGRYYIDEELEKDIKRLVCRIDSGMRQYQYGDIHPAEMAPVLVGRGEKLCVSDMRWGLLGRDKKLIINARAETAMERPLFSESVRQRRCIVPARHFYEWDRDKNKVIFRNNGSAPIYMAGFYRMYEDGAHFIIVTTAANESMFLVHDRMPLILYENEIASWLHPDAEVREFLKKSSPMLERTQDYEQISLF